MGVHRLESYLINVILHSTLRLFKAIAILSSLMSLSLHFLHRVDRWNLHNSLTTLLVDTLIKGKFVLSQFIFLVDIFWISGLISLQICDHFLILVHQEGLIG